MIGRDLEKPIDWTAPDETDFNLRVHLSRISENRLCEYDPDWSDGALMLVCCERDIEVAEYRTVLEEGIRLRI